MAKGAEQRPGERQPMTNRERNKQKLVDFIGSTKDGVVLSQALRHEVDNGLWFGSGHTSVDAMLELREDGVLEFDKVTGRFRVPQDSEKQ